MDERKPLPTGDAEDAVHQLVAYLVDDPDSEEAVEAEAAVAAALAERNGTFKDEEKDSSKGGLSHKASAKDLAEAAAWAAVYDEAYAAGIYPRPLFSSI